MRCARANAQTDVGGRGRTARRHTHHLPLPHLLPPVGARLHAQCELPWRRELTTVPQMAAVAPVAHHLPSESSLPMRKRTEAPSAPSPSPRAPCCPNADSQVLTTSILLGWSCLAFGLNHSTHPAPRGKIRDRIRGALDVEHPAPGLGIWSAMAGGELLCRLALSLAGERGDDRAPIAAIAAGWSTSLGGRRRSPEPDGQQRPSSRSRSDSSASSRRRACRCA